VVTGNSPLQNAGESAVTLGGDPPPNHVLVFFLSRGSAPRLETLTLGCFSGSSFQSRRPPIKVGGI
jgi:hypothetical protein